MFQVTEIALYHALGKLPEPDVAHRFCRRGEDQGEEAPCPGRYARFVAPSHRTCGRYPGPRRWRSADGNRVRSVSVPAEALRRRWLPRATVSKRPAARRAPDRRGNREAIRCCERLCRLAEALDRRTNDRLAQPMPAPGQGLGMSEPKGARIPALGIHPAHAAKAMSGNAMIPDRLLGRA